MRRSKCLPIHVHAALSCVRCVASSRLQIIRHFIFHQMSLSRRFFNLHFYWGRPRHRQSEAAVDFCLGTFTFLSVWVQAERHRQGHWSVAAWRHVFVPVDSTLNIWLIEITVCLLNGFVFTRTLFRANFDWANVHIVPFQFVKNSYTLSFWNVLWRRYLGEVGKIYCTFWLTYQRHCVPISIKIGQVLYKVW